MADNRLQISVTWVLVGLSTALLQTAAWDADRAQGVAWSGLALALTGAAVLRQIDRRTRAGWLPPALVAGLVLLYLLPLASDCVARRVWNFGDTLEMQFTYSIRNVMLGLAACTNRPRLVRLAAFASLFLALSAFLILFNLVTASLAAVYALVGMWWLMGAYWDRVEAHLPARSQRRLPLGVAWGTVALSAVVAGAGMLGVAHARFTPRELPGFFPGSGGTQWYDPFARSGVNDGDQLVGGIDNALSFGPVETQLFLESDMPSLYDTFNDMYDEPAKPKEQERAVPLDPDFTRRDHQERSEHEGSSREFQTVRRRTQAGPPPRSIRSPALLYVTGRSPLHLRLEVFTAWDGSRLIAGEAPLEAPPGLKLDASQTRIWADLGSNLSPELFPAREEHGLRFMNLKTRVIPAPPQLTRVHLDRMHSELFFAWGKQGLIEFNGDTIPQLTIMAVESRRTHPRLLARAEFAEVPPAAPEGVGDGSPTLRALAQELAAEEPRGWPQIDAVRRGLASRCKLDANALPAADAAGEVVVDPIDTFLFESRRGPDYLFAASAALLLRELGYRVRVVSGFYVRPENYDHRGRQTGVFPEDVHFWPEVRLSDGTWIPVEPTPGYRILYLEPTLLERATDLALWLGGGLWQARWPVLALAFAGIWACRWRAWLLEQGALVVWRIAARGDARRTIDWTLWLLEVSGRCRGRTRPAGVPIAGWYQPLLADRDARRTRFVDLCQWSLYGRGQPCPWECDEVDRCCQAIVTVAFRTHPRDAARRSHSKATPATAPLTRSPQASA